MKQMLIDLEAVGCPAAAITEPSEPHLWPRIKPGSMEAIKDRVREVIRTQLGDGVLPLFKCQTGRSEYAIKPGAWRFDFGCAMPDNDFWQMAGKFAWGPDPQAEYLIARDEAGACDDKFVLRAADKGVTLPDGRVVLLANRMPEDMLDKMFESPADDYAILTIM